MVTTLTVLRSSAHSQPIGMAERKGRIVALYMVLALMPGVNIVSALWLASQNFSD